QGVQFNAGTSRYWKITKFEFYLNNGPLSSSEVAGFIFTSTNSLEGDQITNGKSTAVASNTFSTTAYNALSWGSAKPKVETATQYYIAVLPTTPADRNAVGAGGYFRWDFDGPTGSYRSGECKGYGVRQDGTWTFDYIPDGADRNFKVYGREASNDDLSASLGSEHVLITSWVSQGTDDGEEFKNPPLEEGDVHRTSSDLELSDDGTQSQWIGMRFQNITIPPGATITNAYVQFTTDVVRTPTTNLTVYGQDIDDAPAITGDPYNISSRVGTPDITPVDWPDVPLWDTALEQGVDQRTPDISSIIQAIIDTTVGIGWQNGNALVIIIDGTGRREAESYEGANGHGDLTLAPYIHIEYTESAPDLQQIHYRWRDDNGPETDGGSGWYNADWGYRKKITISENDANGVVGTGDFNNFPVLISLTDTDLRDHVVQADGGDILFTDSTGVKLDHEIEKQYEPSTGELIAWVEVPTLSGSSPTDIYMYYGNSDGGLADQWNIPGTWDNSSYAFNGTGYVAVWHFDETAGTHYDSANNNDSVTVSVTDQNAAGRSDGADEYELDNSDYVDFGNMFDFSSSDFTIELWFNAETINQADQNTFMSKWDSTSGNREFRFEVDGPAADNLVFSTQDGGSYYNLVGTTAIGTGWYYAAVTVDWAGDDAYLYLNDGIEDSEVDTWTQGMNSYTSGVNIGRRSDGSQYWDGIVDEVRISSEPRTAEWIKTSYNNQKPSSTFYTVYGQETPQSAADFLANEDTPYSPLDKLTTIRLRLMVSNEGGGTSGSIQYRLQYKESTGGTWTNVPDSATTQHWEMSASDHINDAGEPTSDIEDQFSVDALTNPNTNFIAGELNDNNPTTSAPGITLLPTEFTEIEYSIEATINATDSQDYYFRVTRDDGTTDNFTYPALLDDYPKATLTVTVPAAPVATAATNIQATSFSANWNASTGATGYRLDVATDSGFTSFVTGYEDLDVGNVTTYSVSSNITAGTTYYYRVRAYNGSGTSGNSNTISLTT
ncbi:MAG: DUF2341 domain-containing protein, partial [Planctomycetota bacterium]